MHSGPKPRPLPRTLRAVAWAVLAFEAIPVGATEDLKVTFADDVLPLFRNSCLKCHNPEKTKAGLDLSSYDSTLQGSDGGVVIQPGSPDDSLLLQVVLHAEEPAMPPKSEKLPDADIDVIRRWIAGSALESRDSAPAPRTVEAESPPILANLPEFEGPAPLPRDLSLDPFLRTPRPNSIVSLVASPAAPIVAIGGHRQIILYNTQTLNPAGVLPFPEGGPASLRFSPDGRLLVAGGGIPGKSGVAVVFDVVTGRRALEITGEYDSVLAVDIDPTRTHVAIGGPNRLVKIFGATDGKLLHTLRKHTDWVTAAAFSSDGKLLVTGDRAGGVAVWETDSGQPLFDLSGQKGRITGLATIGEFVASSSEDGSVWVWELRDGKKVKSWEAHKGGALSVALATDGRLVTVGRDRRAKLWKRDGKPLRGFAPFPDVALQVGFSEGRVIAGDWTGTVRVWDAENGKTVGELTPNPPTLAERLDAATQRKDATGKHREVLSREAEEKDRRRKAVEHALANAKQIPPDSPERIAAIGKRLSEAQAALADARKRRDQADAEFKTAEADVEKWKAAKAREDQLSAELK